MESQVTGTTMPVLEIVLEPGECVVAETGEMGWISGSIQLATSTRGGGKGLFGLAKRAMAGGGLFMTEYRAHGSQGTVAFPAKIPGQILPVALGSGAPYLVHKHGFLCGTEGVEVSAGFQQSLGAGIFGGDGFMLQKLSGHGTAWVELGGEAVVRDLHPGETLRVIPGHVGMFEETVQFTIDHMHGFRNVLFGGEDLFLAALTGPGRVVLQSLTLPGLAHSIWPYLPQTNGQ